MSCEDKEVVERETVLARLRKKLTSENLWLYILRILLERPAYAYEINKMLKERFHLSPATVTVYAVLYRMAREGLIERKKGILIKPGRIYYAITERGRIIFEEGKKLLKEVERMLEVS